jgi:acetyl-CoA carboxylase carboxyl transferase subunit beta
MNWLSNFTRPGLRGKKPEDARETPDNLWIKDPISGELVFRGELEAAHWVAPSGFHMRIGPEPRFKLLFDDQAWQKIPVPQVAVDPLKFKDDKKYADRLKAARAKVGRDDCMAAAYGRVGDVPCVVLVQDFEFMGGSLGMAAGEAFIAAAMAAVRRNAAMIMVTASGGARMQEGILSLMQMPRTTLAIQSLREAGLPYIVVLADPTTGGVTASYAMLGDVHIAEPGALIGFAGPRVIEQTIRQKLPEGFQRSEYLLDKGMVDMVVDRRKLKDTLAALLPVFMHRNRVRRDDNDSGDEVVDLSEAATAPAQTKRKPTGKQTRAKAAE